MMAELRIRERKKVCDTAALDKNGTRKLDKNEQ